MFNFKYRVVNDYESNTSKQAIVLTSKKCTQEYLFKRLYHSKHSYVLSDTSLTFIDNVNLSDLLM